MGRIPTRALALACALGAGLVAPGVLWAADTSSTTTTSTASTTTAPESPPASTTTAPESPPQDAAATTTDAPPPPASTAEAPPPPTTASAAPPPPAAPRPVTSKPLARAAASGGVTIQGFAFHPGTITVSVGDTVTWTNHDSADHTATASDGSFDTGTLGRGQSGSHTFSRAGTFSYICSIHPNMHGTVVVTGSSSSSGSEASTGSSSGSSSATTAATGSSLPSTGLQVGAVALLGLALLGAGGLLRRAARARDQS